MPRLRRLSPTHRFLKEGSLLGWGKDRIAKLRRIRLSPLLEANAGRNLRKKSRRRRANRDHLVASAGQCDS